MKTSRTFLFIAAVVATTSGCAIFRHSSQHIASSLAQYLYPAGNNPQDAPTIPTLSLPLRVGVAWVPGAGATGQRHSDYYFSENQKIALLNQIVPQFRTYEFVKSVEIIPSNYLTAGGGFQNLNQLRALFGVDVIALVSYDQVQFTHQTALSITYWTVVGTYIFQGERNDTQTLMDAAVYDIASRKLLFRAPGTSRIKASATPVNLELALQQESEAGFREASTNMVHNLQTELADFRQRVKQTPADFKVVHKPGYSSAGATGWVEILTLLFLSALAISDHYTKRTPWSIPTASASAQPPQFENPKPASSRPNCSA